MKFTFFIPICFLKRAFSEPADFETRQELCEAYMLFFSPLVISNETLLNPIALHEPEMALTAK